MCPQLPALRLAEKSKRLNRARLSSRRSIDIAYTVEVRVAEGVSMHARAC